MLDREKCLNCKYWKKEFSEWDYQEHAYCDLALDTQREIDICEHNKEHYNLADYFHDTISGWVIVFLIVFATIIGQIL